MLVGDCEFGPVEVLQQLDRWHWCYVLRQKSDTCVWLNEQNAWHAFGSLVQKAGGSVLLGHGYLTAKRFTKPIYWFTGRLVKTSPGAWQPTCLTCNWPTLLRLRMWIEEMFGDLKKHGFDLESTMLRHFVRLSRLTLAVVLLYVWLMAVGGRTIQDGLRHLVDRIDRRDLSIFQIGLRFIDGDRRMPCLSDYRFPLP